MRKLLIPLILVLIFVGCTAKTEFTVIISEENNRTDPLEMTVTIGGTTYEELTFTIAGEDYTVSQIPTVSQPVIGLESSTKSQPLYLYVSADSPSWSLHIPAGESSDEMIYSADQSEFQPLIDWMAAN